MAKLGTLKHIAGNLIEVRKKIWSIGSLMLLYVIFLSSSPYFYKLLIESLETSLTSKIFRSDIVFIVILWLLFIVGTILLRYIYGVLLLETVQKDWFAFLIKSMRMMLRLPIDYHISIQHGEKQKLIDRASEAVWELGDNGMLHIIPQILVTCILITSGLFINPLMTGISIILLPIAIYGIRILGNFAYLRQKEANTYWDNLFNRVVDSFTNLKVIRIFSREKNETQILTNRFSLARNAQYKIRKFWLIFNGMNGFISTLAQAITLSFGIFFVLRETITLGTLFFFFGFTERIYGPLFALFQKFQETLILIAGYEKMQLLYTMNPERDTGKEIFTGIKEYLIFKDVSFAYPKTTRKVLRGIDITVKKGEKIALIGHTGSGKSTIVQLLMRFYYHTHGSIEVDGKDIKDFTLESYRKKFASVFQDTTLFNESIRHNLEYVRDGITEKELKKACKKANILDFIEGLPEKWETEVGERGLKLSGGEKQRIAIARAILADPEVLILDEATSALDTETERLIQESLENLMKGRTSIIIAHRLSTIQHVDRIYMIENGEIIANGNHGELMKTSEKYRHLIELQHNGFVGKEMEEKDL